MHGRKTLAALPAALLPTFLIRWQRSRRPALVVYCPVLSQVTFCELNAGDPRRLMLTAADPAFFDAAIAARVGRAIVYVSLGTTVLTSDDESHLGRSERECHQWQVSK
jgi:hypothetical protein